MSWVNDKSTIKAVLLLLNYSEVSADENTEDQPFASHQHFYYKLEKTGADGLGLTSNAAAYSHNVLLECFYINNQDHSKDMNADNFDSVMESIIGMSGFLGEISNTFDDIDEDHSKGIFEFNFGFTAC